MNEQEHLESGEESSGPKPSAGVSDWRAPARRYLPDEFAGDPQFATTLAKGLEILHCFSPQDTQLSNAELAARTGMSRPTISRFTYTLVRLGYLRLNRNSGKYQLGSAVLSLGYPLLSSLNVRQLARPFMGELAEYAHGSVSLGMRDRLNVVYLESSRGTSANLHPPDVGLSYPIVRTAMGRAFVAACSHEERQTLFNELKVKTPEDWETFHSVLENASNELKHHGFCVSYGDLRREVHAVAVPMRPLADGEILVFNCGVSAMALNEGQLMLDIGPRLVAMVRNIEKSIWNYYY